MKNSPRSEKSKRVIADSGSSEKLSKKISGMTSAKKKAKAIPSFAAVDDSLQKSNQTILRDKTPVSVSGRTEEQLLRDEFFAVASHELRTPLTSMRLHNDLIRMISEREGHSVSKEQLAKLLNLMDQQIFRLERIVSDMLEVFKIKEGQIHLEKESFDIIEISQKILEKLQSVVMPQLTPSPLISSSGAIRGSWDKLRVEKMLTHVLTNAFKYGRGKPVSINIVQVEERVRIEVSDQGSGISAQFKEKIFEKFERGICANEVSGFGLGLYYSKKIVEAHEGKIWFESEVDQGTKFVIELPLNLPDVQKPSEFH